MINTLQIVKTRNVKTPERGTAVAAGLDFFVPNDLTEKEMVDMATKTGHFLTYNVNTDGFVESILIKPGQSACIPSGIKVKIPHGYCMEFKNKSGVACKKSLISGACLIDEDYQGVIHVDVHNVSSTNSVVVKAGDKLAQFVMYAVEYPTVEVVESEEKLYDGMNSARGEGAFGSTGTK